MKHKPPTLDELVRQAMLSQSKEMANTLLRNNPLLEQLVRNQSMRDYINHAISKVLWDRKHNQ